MGWFVLGMFVGLLILILGIFLGAVIYGFMLDQEKPSNNTVFNYGSGE